MTPRKPRPAGDLPSSLEGLTPHERNPRAMERAARGGLRASVRELGDISGVVFNVSTGRLVAGHRRREILIALRGSAIEWEPDWQKAASGPERWGTVRLPSGEAFRVRAVQWDEGLETTAMIAANSPAITGTFTPDLQRLLAEAKAARAVLFEDTLLDELLASARKKTADHRRDRDEPVEVAEVAVSRLGDVWVCGRHVVACLDCLTDATIEQLALDISPPDLVIADPPYGLEAFAGKDYTKGNTRGRSTKGVQAQDYAAMAGDATPDTARRAHALFTKRWPGVLHVFWGANYYTADALGMGLPNRDSWLVWDKTANASGGARHQDNNGDCELAWTNRGGSARVFPYLWKGFNKAGEKGQRRIHPTQKPVALAAYVIERYAKVKPLRVFVPFGGSGSDLIACEDTGVAAVVTELSPNYVDAIVRRWQTATGRLAVLTGDGMTFSDVEKARRHG